MKKYKIAVAGTGYVGLVAGVCFAEVGHNVMCVDVDEKKVKLMESGISPIYEDGLEELMKKNVDRLEYTVDYKNAYKDADVIFIAVGTPEKHDGSANLIFVNEVATQIAESIQKDCVVVVKSTVPIGTNCKIEKLIRANLKHEVNVYIASNPEFLAQGTAVRDTLKPSRIIIGAEEEYAKNILKELYESFDAPILTMSRKSAEMVKYASNDFLALKISYINEIANLCDIVDANVEDVAKGMGLDERIGNKFLNAGIGYGGSCFPKDTKALHWLSNFNDYELKTIKAAIEVNENQKVKLIKKAMKHQALEGLTIAVLGLTFKPGTDDLREAPSLVNIPIMLDEGANVKAWDPIGINNFKRIYPTEITYCETIDQTLKDADMCFIFTEWEEVKNFNIAKYKELMKAPRIYDGRNIYNLDDMKKNDIEYYSIGRN